MKVQASVKKRCKDCITLKRRNGRGIRVLRVKCGINPKHNQRQG